MPDNDESAHRHHYRAVGDAIQIREPEEVEGEDGVFEIRMPIASTGDVRNEDDDPLTRGELEGFARQLSERSIGVFPAHGGDDMIASGRYSPFERLGNWNTAEFQTRSEDGDDGVLMATARMPDPETLPAATKEYRTALAILKEQATRGIDQDASIGWREDDDFDGGNDLMEASIVGIGADWRTNTGDEAAEVVTQAALDAGADKADLLEHVRAAIADREGRPLGPEDDPQRFDDWDDCMSAMQESGHSEEEAKRICGSFKEDSEGQDADTSDTNTQNDENMSNQESDDEPTDEQDAADDAETQDGETEQVRMSSAEIADMAEDIVMGHIEQATEELRNELEDAMDDGGENESDDGEDDEEEEEDEDDEEMNTSDADEGDTEQSGDDETDELRDEVQSLQDELEDLRDGGVDPDDVDTPDPDDEQDADDDESEAEQTRDTPEDPTQGLGDYR